MQTATEQLISLAPAAPQFINPGKTSPLDDPREWLRSAAMEAPLATVEVNAVQREMDSIIGTTRNNESIAKLIWNGDVRYWKQYHNAWETETGRPVGNLHKRPQVLYVTIRDKNRKFVRDAFPPRWLLMTRIEPEQYVHGYQNESRFFHPDLKKYVQLLPSEPPPVMYVWHMTIADHHTGCCQVAAKNDATCYGFYAHPRACIEKLQNDRRGMEEAGTFDTNPFDSPDRVSRRLRDHGNNDYVRQAMTAFEAQINESIEETPFSMIDPTVASKVSSPAQLKDYLKEEGKKALDWMAQKLKRDKIEG